MIFSKKYETCERYIKLVLRSYTLYNLILKSNVQYIFSQLDLIQEAKTTKILQSFIFSAYLITTYHNQQGLLDDAVDSNIWIIQFSFCSHFWMTHSTKRGC